MERGLKEWSGEGPGSSCNHFRKAGRNPVRKARMKDITEYLGTNPFRKSAKTIFIVTTCRD